MNKQKYMESFEMLAKAKISKCKPAQQLMRTEPGLQQGSGNPAETERKECRSEVKDTTENPQNQPGS